LGRGLLCAGSLENGKAVAKRDRFGEENKEITPDDSGHAAGPQLEDALRVDTRQ
jgi:hypothetical protein